MTMTWAGRAGDRRSDLTVAARDAGVVWLGLFTIGIGFGVLVTSHGLPWWLAPTISALVFAGSVEFLLIGLLAAAAPIASIALLTFMINSRHLFYGLSFPLHRVRGRARQAYSVFALTDEAYALATSRDAGTLTSGRLLWTQFGLHASWVTGALAGQSLLSGVKGLGFVLTALFLVLAIDGYRARPDRATLTLAVVAGLGAHLLAPGSMLLVAMAVFAATLVVRSKARGRRRPEPDGADGA
ncbi:MAG TPA: AzlC family ABC transporter permease [Streptosporangiaceae bacterium]